MTETLNNNVPYSSKTTDEIMSRYRPIAPKPTNNSSTTSTNNTTNFDNNAPLVPEKFRQSPYLRNMWSHLQARPTRTRKRGRNNNSSPITTPAALLRKQQQQLSLDPTNNILGMGHLWSPTNLTSARRSLSVQAFHHHQCNDDTNNNNIAVVELPLLPFPMLSRANEDDNGSKATRSVFDLNTVAYEDTDMLQLQLQVPSNSNNNNKTPSCAVISPRPVRPVGSSISIVGPISDDPEARVHIKAPEEAEAEAEAEAIPAIISDRSNKVRMVNSAYKELVGQPECSWLDSMCSGGRISGEVVLQLSEFGVPKSTNGFCCWVRIEWEKNGNKDWVNAFCQVVKMVCTSKDYVHYWRFHTREDV